MTDITVKMFSKEINISVNDLLKQFFNAGIEKVATDYVSSKEKEILLKYLNYQLLSTKQKPVFKKKTKSILNISDSYGRNRSIKIEIRKKHYIYNPKLEKKEILNFKENKFNKFKTNEENNEEIKKLTLLKENITILNKEQRKDNNFKIEKISLNKNNNKLINLENFNKENKYYFDSEIKLIESKKNLNLEKEDIKEYCFSEINRKQLIKNKNEVTLISEKEKKENQNEQIIFDKKNYLIDLKKKKRKNFILKTKFPYEKKLINSKLKINENRSISLKQKFNKPDQLIRRNIIIGKTITISELSKKMAIKSSEVINTMMKLGTLVNKNQIIDQETAYILVEEMGHKPILYKKNKLEKIVTSNNKIDNYLLKPRAPIVTIMGHVDHGKTSLLDCIRTTNIVEKEIGGITQRIGAYSVKTEKGMITFLDTPGHAAFTSMRKRGVQVTDIVVLIVAVDDGIMPQTIEAIKYAKSANVPIVVAISKIDKHGIEISKIKEDLAKNGLLLEEWGGEIQCICISVKKNIGISNLLDAILLQSEMLELKAYNEGAASGVVIESSIDRRRGAVTTILVQSGTLNLGDNVICGSEYGRIKAMQDQNGSNIKKAGPSVPVEILGLSGLPEIGDEAKVIKSEKILREIILYRKNKSKNVYLYEKNKGNLKNSFFNLNNNLIPELSIVLKSDTKGSLKTIIDVIYSFRENNKLNIKIVNSGVGFINLSDVKLASTSNSVIFAFNVSVDKIAKNIIKKEKIIFYSHSVIYHLIDDLEKIVRNMILPKYKKEITGVAEVRSIFHSKEFGLIAGCFILEGIIKRNEKILLIRNDKLIYESKIESIRKFKEDIKEAKCGVECGIGIKNFKDININDIIQSFKEIKIK